MKIDKSKTVAISGYSRDLILKDNRKNCLNRIDKMLNFVIRRFYKQGFNTFMCCMNPGFDLIAIEAVLKLKERFPDIRMIVVLPCAGYRTYYSQIEEPKYNILIEKVEIIYTSIDRHNNMYTRQIGYLVTNSSFLIAYYNDTPGIAMYGVSKAKEVYLPTVNIRDLVFKKQK